LAAVDDPSDRSKRGKAWISPFFAVPLAALPDLDELADSHPLLARLVDWKDLADSRRFERLFSRILDDSGVIRRELFLKDHERGLTNYQHLFEILLEDARATGAELGDLIKTLDAYILGIRKPPGEDGNVQRLESDRDAVQIMSIHKSKGLEAAVVFLYGGFTGFRSDGFHEYHDEAGRRILSIGEDETAKDLAGRERQEELQRLYYVAMTRAKARLYLPLVPRPHWNPHWNGGYKKVNERLLAVVDGLEDSGKADRFRRVPFRDAPIRPWI
ncbi:3'-5' exonuclease, partial [Singulisphaera rosea]